MLPSRWTPLTRHETQQSYYHSPRRFNVAAAGRRSGKSEIAKRRAVKKGLNFCSHDDGWFVFAAPTYPQAKRIFWNDIKKLIPTRYISKISESSLTVRLFTGTEFQVLGMDQPERAEGRPLDHIVLDEYGNMKRQVWPNHIRPALSTIGRFGSADLTGVPEGKNHYYDLFEFAKADETGQWSAFHWTSAEILPAEEIEAARHILDPLTFAQEYEADFVSFAGRAYYSYESEVHLVDPEVIPYNPNDPLILCFDFNVSPGVCAIIQEVEYGGLNPNIAGVVTGVVDEIWIGKNSNTKAVCREIIKKYGNHNGLVLCYGDATGGAKGTAKVDGSDWDIIHACLQSAYGVRLKMRVPGSNPRVRVRVNSVNSRLMSTDGAISMLVSKKAKHVAKDLEGVETDDSGDLVKDGELSHISDALGYYIAAKHSIVRDVMKSERLAF